jgi:hypothetical protein
MTATDTSRCHSILLILPYFGPFPRYADLFFRSCAANPSVNWLLVTDQELEAHRVPPNVAIKRMTFSELRASIDIAVGFKTSVPNPYKLSDFRPAYGMIFADEVQGFDFWGHCDLDVIFGDVRKFLTEEVLRTYDKVLMHGHLSLYRNCHEANHYFKLEAPGISFRDVFTTSKLRAFDEFGGLTILLKQHKVPYFRCDDYLADIDQHVYRLNPIQPPHYRHQCFYWEEGKVFRDFWDGTRRGTQEYLCIHLQKRPMSEPPRELRSGNGSFYIMPRRFVAKLSEPRSPAEMDQLNPSNVVFDSKQQLISWVWNVKHAIMQKVDPWPRRV